MLKKAIIVVSLGSSYTEACEDGILPIENAIREEFVDYKVVRAFLSGVIRNKLENKYSLQIDSPAEAIERLLRHGYTQIYLQPTLVIPGKEYDRLSDIVREYNDISEYTEVLLGKPLLHTDTDLQYIVDSIINKKQLKYPDSILVYMGHGTTHFANSIYFRLLCMVRRVCSMIYFTVTESAPSFQEVVAEIAERGIKFVVLVPFTIVAGNHVLKDMVSDDPASLKSQFQRAGVEAECLIRGLGGEIAVQRLFVRHLYDLMGDDV